MTTPIPVTEDPRTTAWRGAVDILTRADELKPLRIDWRTPDSSAFDDAPTQNRITVYVHPSFGEMERIAFVAHGRCLYEATVRLTIKTVVPGTLAANSQGLWGAIERALTSADAQDIGVLEHWKGLLADYHISDLLIERPGDSAEDFGVGDGSIVLTVYFER